MLISTLPKNCLDFSCNDMVDNICAPLFRNTQISYFDYSHYYHDGTCFSMSTNPQFTQRYVELRLTASFNEVFHYPGNYAYMSPAIALPIESERYTNNIKLAVDFNATHRIYLFNKLDKYVELAGFGIDSCHLTAPNVFINNLDTLKKFVIYFRAKASKLINHFSKNRIKNPNDIRATTMTEYNLRNFNQTDLEKELELGKYSILVGDEICTISPREMECLDLLKSHPTAKMIAKKLNVSPRTVEAHLNNLKIKLNCRYKSELMSIAEENNI